MAETDTSAIEEARDVLVSVADNKRIRTAILQQLIDSSEAAERSAPSAWAVTLFRDGFRLNVGNVEVFVLSEDVIRLNCVGVIGKAPFRGPSFRVVDYKSVPEPSCQFMGPLDEFVDKRMSLQGPHLRFVFRAATTEAGQPRRGTPYRSSNSPGLIAYAHQELNRSSSGGGIPDGITREDVLDAIEDLNAGVEHEFGPSLKYDLVLNGRRYPPKAVIGLAAARLAGRVLTPSDFSGGEDSKSTRILRDLGFVVEARDIGSVPDTESTTKTSGYWWVNHKQTYSQETAGHYLWSPKVNRNKARNRSYDNMARAVPGDVVFSYADGLIQAVGIVSSAATTAPKPNEFEGAGENWNDEGWRLPVTFTILESPLRPKNHMDSLASLLPDKHSPIRASGDGNQGTYLAEIPAAMATELRRLLQGQLERVEASRVAPIQREEDPNPEAVEERAIYARTDIGPTQKQTLVDARRGQGLFRERVIGLEGKCRITGLDIMTHLRASHIKPWKDSSDQERLDGNNGLLLAPHVDHLFDRGFISFTDFGDLLVSPRCPEKVLAAWGIPKDLNVGPFRVEQRAFLAWHRRVYDLE